jgi:uncharacterized protein (DUF2267 family)
MPSLLSQLPDPKDILQIAASVQSTLNGTAASLGKMQGGGPGSPLASVAGVFEGLSANLSIDVSGLTQGFPSALKTMSSAIAPASVDFVRSIESGYQSTRGFLSDSAIVKEVGEGRSLQEAALAIVQGALNAFDQRRAALGTNVIDASLLSSVRDAFTALNGFKTDFNAHRDEFLPFMSKNLLGVAPDFLRQPLESAGQAVSVVGSLDPASVQSSLGAPLSALGSKLRDMSTAIDGLNPADAAGYAAVRALVDQVEALTGALADAIDAVYATLRSAIDNHAWNTIFSTHRSLLETLSFEASLSASDVVNGIVQALEAVFARLQAMFGPGELAARIQALSKTIRDTFENSPLGEIRKSIRDFLVQIRQAIESVPTEKIQQAIDSMLGRIRQEIDSLGITQIAETIENGFQEAEQFINDNINEALRNQVTSSIESLLSNLQNLPIDTLVNNFNQLATQLDQVIQDIETALEDAFNQLSGALSQLEGLTFKPVGDSVVSEIDEIKAKLQTINPNSLSDAEKLAIRGAMAVLEAINLEDFIQSKVQSGFEQAKQALLGVVDQVTAVLGTLRDRVKAFEPKALVQELTSALEEAKRAVEQLSARALMKPFYDELQNLESRLSTLSPGSLLTPLEGPFQTVRSAVDKLNPDQLVAPLNAIYAQIDGLVDKVDVTPLLEDLDRRQKELFQTVRNQILSAFDSLSLPEPLAGFFTSLRPALEAITGAFFDDPSTEVRRISTDFASRFKISSLFAPLDRAFDELVGMLGSVPEAALVDALNGVRTTISVGLDVIDPGRIVNVLRAAQGQLASLAPPVQFAMALRLPSFQASFELKVEGAPVSMAGQISATRARFETAAAAMSARLAPLTTGHQSLVTSLRSRINSLDLAGSEAAYGRVKRSLHQVVPEFLFNPQPLTHREIMDGIRSLRPSSLADPVDKVFDRFLAHLKPMQAALDGAINEFFSAIHQTLGLINPLSLKDAVADIYTAIREKLQIIDPVRLAAELHTAIFDPLVSALSAIDPAALRNRLDAAFQSVVTTLSTNVRAILDQIVAAVDQQFQNIREAVATVVTRITDALNQAAEVFQDIVDRLEQIVFAELLERLRRIIETLGVSFEKELGRVRSAFDAMLNAIPLGGASETGAVSL